MNPPIKLPLTIHVTQEDINSGIPKKCSKCPVALAINRATGLAATVKFHPNYIGENEHDIFMTPDCVIAFINKFDAGNHVSPFSFTITEDDRI